MGKIKKLLNRNIYPFFFKILPVKNNKIVFTSYAGKQYSDSPRVISEEINLRYPNIDIVWIVKNKVKFNDIIPPCVRLIENDSFKAAYELYTAKVWIDNCRKPLFFSKRKKQIYIQCWHGTPLKLIEDDARDTLSKKYRKYALRDTKNMDLLISGNVHSTKIFRKAFRYKGDILECGTPRNDILVNGSSYINKSIRNKLGCENKKLILYAPTFRNELNKNGEYQLNKLDINMMIEEFEKLFNEDCLMLVRFHPNVAEKINKSKLCEKYKGKVIDVSIDWDMQELLCIIDVLITDYSSSFFDFAILKKPIFLFALDKDSYEKERGFYFDIYSLPICVAENKEELVNLIRKNDIKSLNEKSKQLLKQIGNKEMGNATNQIIDFLEEKKVLV